MTENGRLPDYNTYSFTVGQKLVLIGKMIMTVALCSFFFYRSLWAAPILSPLAYLVQWREKKKKSKEVRRQLNKEFMECMMSVSVSLQAGYSIENAFLESRKDMETFYGKDSCIYRELEGFRRGLVMHIPLEQLLFDLGDRSGVEDIVQFAKIFSIAKKRGGDLNRVITNTVDRIRERVEIGEEIHVLLAGKQMEQQIMRMMPFVILGYIGLTYPGHFDPFYGNLSGIAIMTVAFLVYLGAYVLGDYILAHIESEMTSMSHHMKVPKIPDYETGLLGRLRSWLEKRDRWMRSSLSIRQNLEFLYPQMDRGILIKQYLVHKWICLICFFGIGSLLFSVYFFKNRAATGSLVWYPVGLVGCLGFAVSLFFMMDKDLGSQVVRKKQALRMEYPEIVHKLNLYMGAGLSVRACFTLLKEEYESVLYACRDFQAGMLETVVYERFGRRLGIKEYIRLGMLLSQNCRRGNAGLLDRLEEEALHITKERQQEVKILGEKAQTKLLLPMVLMLFVVMLLIIVPAFMEL